MYTWWLLNILLINSGSYDPYHMMYETDLPLIHVFPLLWHYAMPRQDQLHYLQYDGNYSKAGKLSLNIWPYFYTRHHLPCFSSSYSLCVLNTLILSSMTSIRESNFECLKTRRRRHLVRMNSCIFSIVMQWYRKQVHDKRFLCLMLILVLYKTQI